MRHAKRTRLKVEDIDYALKARNMEVREVCLTPSEILR